MSTNCQPSICWIERKIMINKEKLKGKIVEHGMTQVELSKIMNIANNSLSRKINGKTPFTLGELQCIKNALELTSQEMTDIFFAEEVGR